MKTTKYKIFCLGCKCIKALGCTICGSEWHNRSSCPWIQNEDKVNTWSK